MKFPSVKEIASTSVTCVDINDSVSDALNMMLQQSHRDVIVSDGDSFRILTVSDIIKMQSNHLDLEIPLSECKLSKIPLMDKNKNILDTMEYLNHLVEYICVINSDKTLYGLITHTDITSNIDPDTLMDNYRLSDYLKIGRRIMWVKKDFVTSKLFNDMVEKSFDNALIVEDNKPIGILTTKDMLNLIKYKKDLKFPVSEYMTTPVDAINNNSSIKEALDFVKKKHYKRVVVVDDEGVLSGVITQKELIALTYGKWVSLIKEHQTELNEANTILEKKNIEYEIKASTDQLTGLYNRYKFEELFRSACKTLTQEQGSMSLILLDIDHFKKINDNYGHNIGDQVLIQLSHMLLRTLRGVDIVCRWGGEEFLVLLPTATLENALKLAEKLRVYISEQEIDIAGKITASFGISQFEKDDNMKDLIERADKALYLAKRSGRNCIKTELDIQSTGK